MTDLGSVVTRRHSVPMTAEDALELGRMIHGEGGSAERTHAAMLVWTVIQRWQWLPRYRDGALITFLRDFSEPLMRERLAGGADCLRMPHANACDEAHMARRAIIQALSWDQLSDIAKETASGFVAAALPNPAPGSIDFAAWPIGSQIVGYTPIARFRSNVFYAYKTAAQDTTRWHGTEVYVELPDGTRSRAGVARFGVLAEIPLFVGGLLAGGT